MTNEIIVKIDRGEKADELRDKIIEVINEYSNMFSGYELVGIIDTVREDCHNSIQEMEEE